MARTWDIRLDKYQISRNRYRELKYMCLQYREKKDEIRDLRELSGSGYDGMPHGSDVTNPTAQKAERMNTGTIKHGTRTGSGRSMERKAGGPEMTTLLIWGCTFLVVAACVLAAGLMHEAGKNSREEEDEH